jgi:hypothetical protein
MTMQSDNKSRGLSNNLTAQMAILAIAVVVLLLIASRYIW